MRKTVIGLTGLNCAVAPPGGIKNINPIPEKMSKNDKTVVNFCSRRYLHRVYIVTRFYATLSPSELGLYLSIPLK